VAGTSEITAVGSVGGSDYATRREQPGSSAVVPNTRNAFAALQRCRKTAMFRDMETTFLTVQSRGTLALPPDLRKRHGLDEPGAQVEVVERDDGVIELHPFVAVPRVNLMLLDEEDSAFFARQVTSTHSSEPALRRAARRRTRTAKGT
jgi:bifunctional DNA-binding transcriptional regulator/antitoxin component of YhaV-PrlF toxin-antitoxin module